MTGYEPGYVVPMDILEAATVMDLPSTAHTPDIAEEEQIAQADFSLASIGVESPILLSQFEGAYPDRPLL